MKSSQTIYDDVADFIASMDPSKVIAFQPTPNNQKRLDFLLDKQIESGLSHVEKEELDHYLVINRIIGLAKARALKLLSV